MSYFADLTPHTYAPTDGLHLLNIGWLDKAFEFPRGSTSPEFREAMHRLCRQPVHLHRGFHFCPFCPRDDFSNDSPSQWERRGNGQIRVEGESGIWYAAPTLIQHYVVAHEYQPPPEFIAAVLRAAKHAGNTRCQRHYHWYYGSFFGCAVVLAVAALLWIVFNR